MTIVGDTMGSTSRRKPSPPPQPRVLSLVTLLLGLLFATISCSRAFLGVQARKSMAFPNMPTRCPVACTCDSVAARKRVLCTEGTLVEIPTGAMDRETQVIVFSGSEDRPNDVTLGRIFLDFSQLAEVTITHSGLPAIGDSSFWPGRELRKLDLSHNRIRLVRDMNFNGLGGLQHLNLSDNYLTDPPSAPFRFLSNLTRLSLARNRLSKLVPRLFYQLGRLEFLDLSDNPLVDGQLSAETFKDVRTLKTLRLERSRVRTVSAEAYKELPVLKELQLSDNQLSFVSSFEFTSLANLKILSLDGNQLTTIRDNAFYGLRLLHLGLARNQLSSLPSCAFCNLALESLDMSSNKFLAFQGELLTSVSMSLVALNVAGNTFLDKPSQSVRRLIAPLQKVQLLRLSNMAIEPSLEDDTFANLSKLVSLDLSSNRLSNLSDQLLKPLINLETIDLSFNSFKGLDKAFLVSLDAIYTLKAIYLHGNPWSCYRCHAIALMDWINQVSPSAYFNVCKRTGKHAGAACIKCAGPERLLSKDLHILTELELEFCSDPTVQLRLTASEPRLGFLLGVLVVVSLTLLTIAIVVTYRYRQGAVYYTREEERYDHAARAIGKMPKKKEGCFSIMSTKGSGQPFAASKVNGKHPFAVRKSSSSSCTSTAPLNNGSHPSPPSPDSTRPKVRF